MKKNEIIPQGFNVVAEVLDLPDVIDKVAVGSTQATKTEIEFYYAKALKIGEKACIEDQCPELEEGDNVIFSQFGGAHVPTEDGFCKVVRGHDIVAIFKDLKDMKKENITPTGDRILVEIIGEKLVNDGIYDASGEDPREQATQKGVVVSCAKGATQFKKGTVVAFDPYCGNLIVNEKDTVLKTINSFDILFSIKS